MLGQTYGVAHARIKQSSERVILIARIRVGDELKRAPVNEGGRPSKTGTHERPVSIGWETFCAS
jgi:hypothetical protein